MALASSCLMVIPVSPLRRALVAFPRIPCLHGSRQRFRCSSTSSLFDNTTVIPNKEAVDREEPASRTGAAESTGTDSKQEWPAEADARRFRLDSSIEFWCNFGTRFASVLSSGGSQIASNPGLDVSELVRRMSSSNAVRDTQSAAFWAYHTARMSFFITQAVAGLVAHELTERVMGTQLPTGGDVPKTALQRMVASGPSEIVNRVAEAAGTWYQDYEQIDRGTYKLPWDMTTISHRQYNPLFALSRTALFVNEAVSTLTRRMQNTQESLWIKSDMYPPYFMNTYHYQTDGWFSARSAAVYEHSTETLFFGRQDAMQRASLVPVSEWIELQRQQRLSGGDDTPLEMWDVSLLEVAAGTGRFHTYIKDNWPEMRTTCSDLSPFYLAKARENIKYWKKLRQPDSNLGGVDNAGVEFLQAAAESLSVADASQDIVVSVYLFHELPADAQNKAVAEMFRVLRPGGLAVLTDSVQLGDRPEWDHSISNFGNFNEPYYREYVRRDLGAMFEEAGFECGTKWLSSSTKTLSFLKPGGAGASNN